MLLRTSSNKVKVKADLVPAPKTYAMNYATISKQKSKDFLHEVSIQINHMSISKNFTLLN